MSYNNDTTSHPEKQVNLVQIAQEVVHNLLQSYNPEPLAPDADGLFHYIYITWRRDTYKFYVGKHTSKNPDTDSYIGSGFHLLNAIEKHGVSLFEHRILQYTNTAQEAFDLEGKIVDESYIKLYRDELRITYNLVGGGGKGVFSEETRQKMSEAQKEYWTNPEAREKKSEVTKKYRAENPEASKEHGEYMKKYHAENPEAGKNHGEYMKKYYKENPEAREKAIEGLKEYWSDPEARQKMSEVIKRRFENNPEARKKAGQASRDRQAIKELTDLSGATKIEVHKDEVLQYLKEGWYFNTTLVALYNPTTLEQVYIHMRQKGKCYKVVNTPRIIKLLEEGWVLGTAPTFSV
jgi:hypothetical protein